MMNHSLQITRNKHDNSILLTEDKSWFSLIWLHGLGDTSKGFLQDFKQKDSSVFKGARVKLLQAPTRTVTIFSGQYYPSWFDYKKEEEEGTDEERYSIDQIKESLKQINKHVTDELQYWKSRGMKGDDRDLCKRIFIRGFSQGCAISLCYGLTSQKLLGGVIGLSGHLFDSFQMKNIEHLPMLVYHGTEDDVINFKDVQPLYQKYLMGRPNFTFKLIEGLHHQIPFKNFGEPTNWMLEQLKKTGITL